MMAEIEKGTISSEIHAENRSIKRDVLIDIDVLNKLIQGFLSIYQKPLEYIKQEVSNLIFRQKACITQLQLTNVKLSAVQSNIQLKDLFLTIEVYEEKLLNIKKEIITIRERTFKLKKRALQYKHIKSNSIYKSSITKNS